MLYKPREKRFLKRQFVRFFFKERDGELRTVVKRELKIWATLKWKGLCIFEISLGDFQHFFYFFIFTEHWTEKFERVGRCEVKFWKIRRKSILRWACFLLLLVDCCFCSFLVSSKILATEYTYLRWKNLRIIEKASAESRIWTQATPWPP